MNTPLIDVFYYEPQVHSILVDSLIKNIDNLAGEPVFLCIGSDKHILDCFGPLIGTMILEKSPDILVYGTLGRPLHAKNLVKEMQAIQTEHPEITEIAIDAAVGLEKDIGIIKFRDGPLLPGKALAKKLPHVGDFSITGIVGERDFTKGRPFLNGSLQHVYHMARVISQAVHEWHLQYKGL